MFSSQSFRVSGLISRSLIHLEFIFVYGVRACSNVILFHVAVQFSQHHLLKRLSFLHCIVLLPLSRLVGCKCMDLILGFLSCSTDLYFVFVPVPYGFDDCSFIVQCEVRQPDSSSSIFLFQDVFGYSGSFVLPNKL